ncbi:amino acid permease/ SLC12A domain-containing protein [Blastocladiella britannica]|nr:amino acid permease/ SLC12A domain-containing protein [Blastocladiella britannica]
MASSPLTVNPATTSSTEDVLLVSEADGERSLADAKLAAEKTEAAKPKAAAGGGVLRREIGIRGAVGLGLSSIIGTGVFVSIGIGAQIAGPVGVLVAIAIACVTATCNALNSAQLAAYAPVSGGTYEYAYRLIHPFAGFMAGWMFLCAKIASGASAAVGFASYLVTLVRGDYLSGTSGVSLASNDRWLVLGIAVGLVLILTIVVLLGIKLSNRANWGMLSVTLASLLFFVLNIVARIDRLPVRTGSDPFGSAKYPDRSPVLNVLEASAIMFVAFTGYGRVATLGDEVRSPRQTIPRAIQVTVVLSAVVYAATGAAAIMGARSMADLVPNPGVAPLAVVVMRSWAGQGAIEWWAGAIVSIGAMTAMMGVLLNLVLGLSRMVMAMAKRGDFPPWFTYISAAGNPTPAIVLIGATIVAVVIGTQGEIGLTWTFSAVTVLVYYAICNISALRLDEEHRMYSKAWGYMGTLICVGLVVFIDGKTWIAAGIVLGCGAVWHAISQYLFGANAPMGPSYKSGPLARGGAGPIVTE